MSKFCSESTECAIVLQHSDGTGRNSVFGLNVWESPLSISSSSSAGEISLTTDCTFLGLGKADTGGQGCRLSFHAVHSTVGETMGCYLPDTPV